jgi:hypothetical protein
MLLLNNPAPSGIVALNVVLNVEKYQPCPSADQAIRLIVASSSFS